MTYLSGRQKYTRPQAMLWAENSGTLSNGAYIPNGYEVGTSGITGGSFVILSDHGRSPISVKPVRIEKRERMINGRMRSYHIADKLQISMSWQMIPSRAFNLAPNFDVSTGKSSRTNNTVDGGAGGNELLDWYNNHTGSFWVYLAYDKYTDFGKTDAAYGHLAQYNDVVEMFISDFNYEVVKRGGSNFDLWNVSVTLEEA